MNRLKEPWVEGRKESPEEWGPWEVSAVITKMATEIKEESCKRDEGRSYRG